MRSSLLLALLPATLCSPTQPSKPAPLLQRRDQTGVLPNKYIVKFKDISVPTKAESILSTLAVTPEHTFEHVFKGFSGELNQETLEALRNHPDVSLYPSKTLSSSHTPDRLNILKRIPLPASMPMSTSKVLPGVFAEFLTRFGAPFRLTDTTTVPAMVHALMLLTLE